MTKPASAFVYVTYIRTTPEKLWSALTESDFMSRWWLGMRFETDWKPGSPWKLEFPDGRLADGGVVVECDRPKRIVLRWRNHWSPELNAEGDAQCVFEVEPAADGAVKLSITHTMDRPESKLIQAVSGGWPRLLSNLKSLLETGDPIAPAKELGCQGSSAA